MPGLDEIKLFFFKDIHIHLHSREIRRKDGIFKHFLDARVYAEFKKRIDALLERSPPTIVSSSIHKIRLLKKAQKFELLAGTPYNIGDIYIRNVGHVLERLGHFLKGKTGKVIFETQGKKESKRIQAMLTTTSLMCCAGTFTREISVNMDSRSGHKSKNPDCSGSRRLEDTSSP